MPENLMIVGQWSTTYNPPRPTFETKGAEIYITNDVPAELLGGEEDDEVRLGNGSSFSTPQISGIVSTLRGLGIPIEHIKPLLFEMAEIKSRRQASLQRKRGYCLYSESKKSLPHCEWRKKLDMVRISLILCCRYRFLNLWEPLRVRERLGEQEFKKRYLLAVPPPGIEPGFRV